MVIVDLQVRGLEMKRFKTRYIGVFYRNVKRLGGRPGTEKVYYVVYKKNGKTFEEKAGRQLVEGMTPARASYIRAELLEGRRLTRKAIREQKKAEQDKYTINKLWNEYSLNRKPGKSLKTDQGRYEKYLKPALGCKEPKDIIKLDIDRIRRKLLKRLAPQSVRHVLDIFSWIVNYGTKNNLCQGISFHVQKPKLNNEKTENLTFDQIESLLESIEADENLVVGRIMKIALFTGLRRGEIFNLQWKDINFETGFIFIRSPKGGVDQKIPMNKMAREVFESIYREDKYVFPGRDGKRTDIGKAGRRILTRAGISKDFRPLHGLRHVYASLLASSGQVGMFVLQKLMTHKTPKMTQRYAHLRDETLQKGAKEIDKIFNQEKKKVVNI